MTSSMSIFKCAELSIQNEHCQEKEESLTRARLFRAGIFHGIHAHDLVHCLHKINGASIFIARRKPCRSIFLMRSALSHIKLHEKTNGKSEE